MTDYVKDANAFHAQSARDATAACLMAGMAPRETFEVEQVGGGCLSLKGRIDTPNGYYEISLGDVDGFLAKDQTPESWGVAAEWYRGDGSGGNDEDEDYAEFFDECISMVGDLRRVVTTVINTLKTDLQENAR